MKTTMKKALGLLLAAVVCLGGCGKSSDLSANKEMMMETAAGNGWDAKAEPEESAMDDAAMAEEGMETPTADGGGVLKEQVSADISERKLIKTVSLSMETKEFDTLKTKLEETVSSFGGYIENSNFDAPQGTYHWRYYSLTVRVPSEKLDDFVATTGRLGTLTNKTENVEDVTLDYVDKTAYKESLRVEYERVTELLEQAEDLEQILALESKLSQLRYEINSYESQLRTYDNLIDYSTVYLSISEVEYEKEVSDSVGSRISNGFRSSLYEVKEFFVDLFVGLVSNLPILFLWAAGLAFVIVLIRKWMKRRKKKRTSRMERTMSEYLNNTSFDSKENTEKEEK